MGGRVGPDSGWSWVIALAACFNSLVLAGIFRTSGVLFVAFISTFGVTREEAAWPMVVCISVLNLTGPLSGLLGQRFGVRPVVMVGALVGAIGVSTCYFTTSLMVITVLFGGVFGVGYGLVSTLMPVIINSYFLDLRGTANGIANSGSCFGSVLLPVLFEYLIESYGLSGCFLLTGGVVLNVGVAGALMRPTPWSNNFKKEMNPNMAANARNDTSNFHYSTSGSDTKSSGCDRTSVNDNDTGDVNESIRRRSRDPNLHGSSTENRMAEKSVFLDPKSIPLRDLQTELLTTFNKRSSVQMKGGRLLEDFQEESRESLDESLFVRKIQSQNKLQHELHRAQREFEDSLSDFQSVVLDIVETSKSDDMLNRVEDEVKTSQLTDNCPARHSFSVANKRPKIFRSLIPSAGLLKKHRYRFSNSSCDMNSSELNEFDGDANMESSKSQGMSNEELEAPPKEDNPGSASVNNNVSVGYLRSLSIVATSPMFYVTAITNVCFYFLFHMFVNIIVDYSTDRGVSDHDTKYVLFSFSVSDLFGRLCLGWITDKKFMTRSRFVMICLCAIGLIFFAFPFATDFWSLIVVSGCYGILLGCTMIIYPILLVDYLGLEIHALAYGCLCFMNGFASFVRPFLIGYFRDNMGSYENMFYVLGVISLVASASWTLERYFLLPQKSTTVQME